MYTLFEKSYVKFLRPNTTKSKNVMINNEKQYETTGYATYEFNELFNIGSDDTYFNIGEELGITGTNASDNDDTFDSLVKVCETYYSQEYNTIMLFCYLTNEHVTCQCFFNSFNVCNSGYQLCYFFVVRKKPMNYTENVNMWYAIQVFINDPENENRVEIYGKYRTLKEAKKKCEQLRNDESDSHIGRTEWRDVVTLSYKIVEI